MKAWIRRLAILAVIVAAGFLLRATVLRPDPVPVTVFVVRPGRVEAILTNSKAGTVRTRRRASLAPEVGGRVERLPVRAGDSVAAGDLILGLAGADLHAQVDLQRRVAEAARAKRREACVTAEQAVRDQGRVEQLASDEVVSAASLEQARWRVDATRAGCAAATADVRQAEAAVVVAEAALGKAELRAPFAGVVAELRTEVGEWVTPSPPAMAVPPVVDLIDVDSIYVSAPLDEVDAGRVEVGQPVRVTLDPWPEQAFAGRVTRVAPYVTEVLDQSRTFEIEVELDDPAVARKLLPGATADVEVILEGRDGALRLPAHSLLEGGRVLVVRGDRIEEANVETGLRNWEFIEVTRGLAEGDRVVTSLDRPEVKAGAEAVVTGETLK